MTNFKVIVIEVIVILAQFCDGFSSGSPICFLASKGWKVTLIPSERYLKYGERTSRI